MQPADAGVISQSRSPQSPPPLRRATPPSPLRSAYDENLAAHIENIPSSLPSSTDEPAGGSSSPKMSSLVFPANSGSNKNQQLRSSRQISGDDGPVLGQHDNSLVSAVNPSTLESQPFEYQNGGFAKSNNSLAVQQQFSSSRSGLTLSPSRLGSSLQQSSRGSENQYNWLERFHEHLEEQQEEVQHSRRQHHSDVPSEEENKNVTDNGSASSLEPRDARHVLPSSQSGLHFLQRVADESPQDTEETNQARDGDESSSG